MELFHPNKEFWIVLFFSFSFLIIWSAIWRLKFHPLSKIPGPKLAALTGLYEVYYELSGRGTFYFKLQELHQEYGTIVRITPREVHICDSGIFNVIYAGSGQKLEKDPKHVIVLGAPESSFATVSHDRHRLRRGPINPFFSKRKVAQITPVIQSHVDQLVRRLEQDALDYKVTPLRRAFMAMTIDITDEYCYGTNKGYLLQEDYGLQWEAVIESIMFFGNLLRLFPLVQILILHAPTWALRYMDPRIETLRHYQGELQRRAEDLLAKQGQHSQTGRKEVQTIFHALVESDLPPEELTIQRLVDEGKTILAAGSETVPAALSQTVYFLLEDKRRLRRVMAELDSVMPPGTATASLQQLEKLPYLSGCINEGIRLMYGTIGRSPRVRPDEALRYKDWLIPPGTPVSMSHYFVHNDADIFPNPEAFDPERWIRAKEKNEHLEKYLVSFGKGSRACAGINLAYAELYLTIAALVRRVDMELFDTNIDDMRLVRDFIVGAPRKGGRGLRIIAKRLAS